MRNLLIRICNIELNGFKSTKHGMIEMPSILNNQYFSRKSDILGIYGQNGSGKTAVVEAMEFMQMLLSGYTLPQTMSEYIAKEQETCSISVTFAMEEGELKRKITYKTDFRYISSSNFQIIGETLTSAKWNGKKFDKQRILLSVNENDENGRFTPDFRYQSLICRNKEMRINLAVAKKMAGKEHRSFFFGVEGLGMFLSRQSGENRGDQEISAIIDALSNYAKANLFVFSHTFAEKIGLNYRFSVSDPMDTGDNVPAKGRLSLRVDQPTTINRTDYHILTQILIGMNMVLAAMIPDLFLDIHEFGPRLMENGMEGRSIQLISRRGKVTIPLCYESEGIIKIISILNILMCVYNNPSICLVVDELDAGIYEYLLGELLSVFEKSARGQLIFTSHNLRPLEMLSPASILFSTSNPERRYIRMKSVKSSQNLRSLYLRSIVLGGQKEKIYEETDILALGQAFRKAGKVSLETGREAAKDEREC